MGSTNPSAGTSTGASCRAGTSASASTGTGTWTVGASRGQQRESIVLSAFLGSEGWVGAIDMECFASLGFPLLGEANPFKFGVGALNLNLAYLPIRARRGKVRCPDSYRDITKHRIKLAARSRLMES